MDRWSEVLSTEVRLKMIIIAVHFESFCGVKSML
jgi:hypothetical protein